MYNYTYIPIGLGRKQHNTSTMQFQISHRKLSVALDFIIKLHYKKRLNYLTIAPLAGVWLVTRPAGGGGGKGPPEISKTSGPISKFQTPFDSPVRELTEQCQKFDLEVTDDVTGQVKVRIFDFSGLVTIGE